MTRTGLYAIAALCAASPALAAPQCVEMQFFDSGGLIIPVNPPMVGLMIGETPLYEGVPPQHARTESGRFVPCPQALVASAQQAFTDFCTSDERRKKAAAANNAEMSVINKRCGDLTAALSN